MNGVTRFVPVAVGLGLGAFVVTSANAGGIQDCQYTTPHTWSVGSGGDTHYRDPFPTGTLQYMESHEFGGAGDDLTFLMEGHNDTGTPDPNVDLYRMSTRTEYGWDTPSFWGAFSFDINNDIDSAWVEYAGAYYGGEGTAEQPIMEVYVNMVLTNTMTDLFERTSVAGGDRVDVKIIWDTAPMYADGTETTSEVTVYPTAVPGGGALALLGLGGIIRRRRRQS